MTKPQLFIITINIIIELSIIQSNNHKVSYNQIAGKIILTTIIYKVLFKLKDVKYRQYNAIIVAFFFSILIDWNIIANYPNTAIAQQKYPNKIIIKEYFNNIQLTQKQTIPTITITIPFSAGVKTLDNYYQPTVITIQTGSKITWKNDDISPHTATSLANDSNSSNNGKIFDTGYSLQALLNPL